MLPSQFSSHANLPSSILVLLIATEISYLTAIATSALILDVEHSEREIPARPAA